MPLQTNVQEVLLGQNDPPVLLQLEPLIDAVEKQTTFRLIPSLKSLLLQNLKLKCKLAALGLLNQLGGQNAVEDAECFRSAQLRR